MRAETISADQVAIVGSTDYGLKMDPYQHSNGLRYRALAFNGKPGDRIGVWVHAQSGVPVAFLTDFNLNVLAGGMARFPAAIPPKSQPR